MKKKCCQINHDIILSNHLDFSILYLLKPLSHTHVDICFYYISLIHKEGNTDQSIGQGRPKISSRSKANSLITFQLTVNNWCLCFPHSPAALAPGASALQPSVSVLPDCLWDFPPNPCSHSAHRSYPGSAEVFKQQAGLVLFPQMVCQQKHGRCAAVWSHHGKP